MHGPCSMVAAALARAHADEVIKAMQKARVPAGPILSTADILQEPQYQARCDQ